MTGNKGMGTVRWAAAVAMLAVAGTAAVAEGDAMAAARQALERCTAAAERGSAIEAQAEADAAERSFAAALADDPASLEARVGIARTLLQCRIEAAPMMEKVALMQRIEAGLGEVLAAAPDHAEAHLLLGVLLYNVPPFLGRTEDAIAHLEAVRDLGTVGRGPDLADTWLFLGDLYLRLGRDDDALAAWRQGGERFPDEPAFAERLAAPEAPPTSETAPEAPPVSGATREAPPVSGAAAEAPPVSDATPEAPPVSRASPEAPPTSEGAERAAWHAAVLALVEREAARGEVPGVAVAVARAGEPPLLAGRGMADVENEVPMTADSVTRIGSLTKQFVAVAVLRLAERGELTVDDPLARWLDLAPAAEGITLRHLLNHTAGLPRDPVEGAGWIAASLAAPRLGAPGERYLYSNLGYALLGRVVEAATGLPFERALAELVLAPAGLAATAPCDERAIVPRRAQGYTWRGARLLNDDPAPAGAALLYAGGLCSTARDLLRWQLALHGGEVLTAEGYRTLLAVPAVADPAGTTYAAGLRVVTGDGGRIVRHSGGVTGFLSELAHHPAAGLSVAVLANSEAADPRSLAAEIARAVLAVEIAAPVLAAAAP